MRRAQETSSIDGPGRSGYTAAVPDRTSRARLFRLAVLAAATVVAGCGASSTPDLPVTPAQPATGVDYFLGRWTTPFSTSIVVDGTPSGCSSADYEFTKIDAASVSVSYDLSCSGGALRGTASAVLRNFDLQWNASGIVVRENQACPFVFTGSTASRQANDSIAVTYDVTICGLPAFRGTHVLRRR